MTWQTQEMWPKMTGLIGNFQFLKPWGEGDVISYLPSLTARPGKQQFRTRLWYNAVSGQGQFFLPLVLF